MGTQDARAQDGQVLARRGVPDELVALELRPLLGVDPDAFLHEARARAVLVNPVRLLLDQDAQVRVLRREQVPLVLGLGFERLGKLPDEGLVLDVGLLELLLRLQAGDVLAHLDVLGIELEDGLEAGQGHDRIPREVVEQAQSLPDGGVVGGPLRFGREDRLRPGPVLHGDVLGGGEPDRAFGRPEERDERLELLAGPLVVPPVEEPLEAGRSHIEVVGGRLEHGVDERVFLGLGCRNGGHPHEPFHDDGQIAESVSELFQLREGRQGHARILENIDAGERDQGVRREALGRPGRLACIVGEAEDVPQPGQQEVGGIRIAGLPLKACLDRPVRTVLVIRCQGEREVVPAGGRGLRGPLGEVRRIPGDLVVGSRQEKEPGVVSRRRGVALVLGQGRELLESGLERLPRGRLGRPGVGFLERLRIGVGFQDERRSLGRRQLDLEAPVLGADADLRHDLVRSLGHLHLRGMPHGPEVPVDRILHHLRAVHPERQRPRGASPDQRRHVLVRFDVGPGEAADLLGGVEKPREVEHAAQGIRPGRPPVHGSLVALVGKAQGEGLAPVDFRAHLPLLPLEVLVVERADGQPAGEDAALVQQRGGLAE
jgi:hypothetical protein